MDEDGSCIVIFVKAHQRKFALFQNRGSRSAFFEAQTEAIEDRGTVDKKEREKTEEALLASLRTLSDELLDLLPGNRNTN